MGKGLESRTVEELQSLRKTLRAVVLILAVLGVVYAGFLGYSLLVGNWDQTKTLGTIPLLGLVVITVPNLANLKAIGKELQRRGAIG